MPLILGTNSIKDTGYEVANSLRFDDGSSDRLSKTYGANATNGNKFTFSCWVKRGNLGTRQQIFSAYDGGAGGQDLEFEASTDVLSYNDGGAGDNDTNMVFRDTSAWYHIVLAQDTTQGSASTQVKIYVNGVQQSLGVNSGASAVSQFGKNGETARIGSNHDASTHYFDGYMAEVVFIDGQQLDATSFGEFDSDSPTIWKPIDVSGLTFGTNGFYLDFEDSSALGNDAAGSNNFTVNNLTAIDQSTDTCTNNFATLNPLYTNDGAITYSEGNLKAAAGSGSASWTTRYAFSSIGVSAGRWYVEAKCVDSGGSNQFYFGVGKDINTWSFNSSLGYEDTGQGWGYYANNGNIVNNGNDLYTSGNSYTDGDIISMELDLEDMTLDFYKNGVKEGYQVTSLPAGTYHFAINGYAAIDGEFNFGSPNFSISSGNSDANGYGNFEYSVLSGHYALNTKNLAEYG